MAITLTDRGTAVGNAASGAFTAYTAALGSIELACITNYAETIAPTPPTISDSTSLVWTELATVQVNGGGLYHWTTLFCAIGAGNSITITAGSPVGPGNAEKVFGIALSAAGADNNFSNIGTDTDTAGDPSVVLGVTPDAASTVVGFVYGCFGGLFTAAGGYTGLGSGLLLTNFRVATSYAAASASATCGWTSTTFESTGIALELKLPTAGQPYIARLGGIDSMARAAGIHVPRLAGGMLHG